MHPKSAALILLIASSPALAQAPEQTPPPANVETQPKTDAAEKQQSAVSQQHEKPPAAQTEVGQTQPTTAPEPKVETPSWTDKVKLSGKAYLRYQYELAPTPAAGNNQFNLDRLYLTSEFMPVDKVRFQATLDAGDTRNSTGNQVFFAETKYAFGELKDFVKGLYLRGGIIPLAWIPYEEDLWTYRVQGPVPVDRWGYITSADLGVSFGGTLPSKFGSFQLNVNNGEGYKGIELQKRKELQGRLTITPLASLTNPFSSLFLTGYGSYGYYDDAGLPDRLKARAIGQIGVQAHALTLVGEYFLARDSNAKVKGRYTVSADEVVKSQGFSAYTIINVGALVPAVDGLDVIARYDLIDPDTTVANNNQGLLIAGVGYRFNKWIKALADYEGVTYGADVGGVGKNTPAESRIKLHTEFKF